MMQELTGDITLSLAWWNPLYRKDVELSAAGVKDNDTDEYIPLPYKQGVELFKRWQLRFRNRISVGGVTQATYEIGETTSASFFQEAGHILAGRL